MTFAQSFYLFILSAVIAIGALGGVAYVRATTKRDYLHPGEQHLSTRLLPFPLL